MRGSKVNKRIRDFFTRLMVFLESTEKICGDETTFDTDVALFCGNNDAICL